MENEKNYYLHGFSFSTNMANSEAFWGVKKLSANLSFLKCGLSAVIQLCTYMIQALALLNFVVTPTYLLTCFQEDLANCYIRSSLWLEAEWSSPRLCLYCFRSCHSLRPWILLFIIWYWWSKYTCRQRSRFSILFSTDVIKAIYCRNHLVSQLANKFTFYLVKKCLSISCEFCFIY